MHRRIGILERCAFSAHQMRGSGGSSSDIRMKLFTIMAILTTGLVVSGLLAARSPAADVRANSQQSSAQPADLNRILEAVRSGFGPGVHVQDSYSPFYLLGDFNGDGYRDIAVLVNADQAKSDLTGLGVSYIDADPYSPTNGSTLDPVKSMGSNCLGIAIIHGGPGGWEAKPMAKYLVYQCFSGFRLVPKRPDVGRPGTKGSAGAAQPKGDSLRLELESGGYSLVYWNGKTYRGRALKKGD
jgi:hypothetical protein